MLEENTLLKDRYRIRHQIGKGGMGTVYIAKDENLGTTVAVKQNFYEEPRLIEAFKREARLLASLRHSALPQVKDYFIDTAGQFLVMEYIGGDDLGTILEKRKHKIAPAGEVKPFDVDEVIRWAEQLLDALDYLHRRGEPVIHRDIKPANLKLAERSQIILLDFGLAKGKPEWMTRVTTTGSIHGYTPNYAPLEQIRGLGTDPRSDLYALGATLYHLVTGTPPVDAATRADAILGGEPDALPAASEINPGVPQSISAVLMKAMEVHRNRRPATAADLLNLLRDAKFEEPQREKTPIIIETRDEAETERNLDEELRQREEAERRKRQEEQERKATEPAERKRRQEEQIAAAIEAGKQAYREEKQREREEVEKIEQQEELRKQREREEIERRKREAERPERKRRNRKLFLQIGGGLLLAALLAWGIVTIWNRTDGPMTIPSTPDQQINTNTPAQLKPDTFRVSGKSLAVSLSDDARVLVSGGLTSQGKETAISVWQPESKREFQSGRCTAVSRDGKIIAAGSENGTIRLWQTSDGKLINTWRGHSGHIFSIGFSPDGKTLFSASGDRTVKLWRASDGESLATINTPEEGYLIVVVSPDLKLVGFYRRDDRRFKLWSASDDSFLRYLEGDVPEVTCGVFSNDGSMLALGSRSGDVRLWRVSDGLKIRDAGKFGVEVVSIAFTSDGQTVAAGLVDGKIKLLRANDGALIKTLEGHTQSVNSLSFSADGRLLASGSDDATVRVWSTN